LDEESNIIVDDEETKREERRSKIWQRRTTLVMNMPDHFDNDLSESTSSEEDIVHALILNILSGKSYQSYSINFFLLF